MQTIPDEPRNYYALAFYLLLINPISGYTEYDAVVSHRFFKFNTRVSDLILKFGVGIHKKSEEIPGQNRFGKPITHTRYCLYTSDRGKNLELYKVINGEKK